jgi:hypothetical protein
MPRYFFDVDDGESRTRDDYGLELHDLEEVRKKAVSILPDVAREELPDGDRRVFVCQARDESGTVLFMATLSLVAEWIGEARGEPSQ